MLWSNRCRFICPRMAIVISMFSTDMQKRHGMPNGGKRQRAESGGREPISSDGSVLDSNLKTGSAKVFRAARFGEVV